MANRNKEQKIQLANSQFAKNKYSTTGKQSEAKTSDRGQPAQREHNSNVHIRQHINVHPGSTINVQSGLPSVHSGQSLPPTRRAEGWQTNDWQPTKHSGRKKSKTR